MAVVLAITLIISVYVYTFQEDFKEDDVGRVTVFGIIILMISLVLIALGSIG